ncbi:MAG: carboxyl transferase domain-containing protein, partial [Myxococcota bacterium]|nr:carboxyl transferase domain-containing protein [Myxococcota bacterium]
VPLVGLLCSAEDVLSSIDWLKNNGTDAAVEVVFSDTAALDDALWTRIRSAVSGWSDLLPRRLTFSWLASAGERHCTFFNRNGALVEQTLLRDIHPEAARRVELWRLQNFHLERLASDDRVYAFIGKAKRNPKDERLFILAEVFGPVDRLSRAKLWEFERAYFEGLRILRDVQAQRTQRTRLRWNWMHFYIHPALELSNAELQEMAREFEPYIRGLSVREVNVRIPLIKDGEVQHTEFAIRKTGRHRLELTMGQPSYRRLPEMSTYDQRVVQSSRRGCVYPYEIIRMLEGHRSANQLDVPHSDIGQGRFQEYDFNENDAFMPVARPLGMNNCGIVVGIMTNCTLKYPEGMPRVWLASDPTRAMGALAEPECKRIIAALKLAEQLKLPVEWIPVSSGAKISMDSGTENLDWTARVLREIILFTQNGGIINLIIHNVNVGAQSYWNAEASMLMHTKGCLIMTMDGSMVLTGKKALDFSGSVSAEDERGIGGAERIMGPNGQAQFIASDLGDAYRILFEWYRVSYKGETVGAPRRLTTSDSFDRSIETFPYQSHESEGFTIVGDIFSLKTNPGRKKPFSIRALLASVIDQDFGHLERFAHIRDAENAVVWET